MKINPKRALTVVGFAAAFSMLALPLSAQQAKFNLPVEVHWGKAILPPGQYRLSIPSATTSPVGVMYIYGEGGAKMALPVMTDIRPESKHSYLRLLDIDGTYVVREFSSGATGKSYLFGIPKTLRLRMTPAQERDVATLVDVSGQ
ncbi:MAG TPA: hypothetical protein VLI55_22560 [Bryobacteraceae bacterium]|nr:hypothetical protein [Bryobacteraceae bacterium]